MGEWTKEPWHCGANVKNLSYVELPGKDYARAVSCVNAMQGHPSPEEFVALGMECIRSAARHSVFSDLKARAAAYLALRTPPPSASAQEPAP